MKAFFLALSMTLVAASALADDDCPSAVDAADAQNPNAYKNCDYSDKGLNGVLHRAFAKKSGDNGNDNPVEKVDDEKHLAGDKETAAAPVNSEFNTAQQLQNLRFSLLQKAQHECPKGFQLDSEKYLPAGKNMKLELVYRCL